MQTNETRWLCTLCGYVHQGRAPPASCPICAATPDLFEPQQAAQSAPPRQAGDQWRRMTCDYIHQGASPPATCPICGQGAEQFEPHRADQQVAGATEDVSVVIVGAGIAGVSAAESIRRASPSARITLLGKEPDLPYYRINLTRYLATYWAEKGVRVNTLTFGGVFNNQDPEFLAEYHKRAPMRRMAGEHEYNGAVVFLMSEAASYMTGSNMVLDGGWTAW